MSEQLQKPLSKPRVSGSFVRLKRKPSKTLNRSTFLELPDTLTYDSFECEVMELGPGELMANGEREPFDFEVGDSVVVYQGAGEDELEDESFIVDSTVVEAVVVRS